jgi:hypothetical protein
MDRFSQSRMLAAARIAGSTRTRTYDEIENTRPQLLGSIAALSMVGLLLWTLLKLWLFE